MAARSSSMLRAHLHFDHGYAVTSHSAQGLTAERVLINADTGVSSRFAQFTVRLRSGLARQP